MSLFKELESLESSPEYLAMSPEERTDVLRGWQSQTTGNPEVDQSRKQVASEAIASRNSFFRAKMPVNPLTGALRETAPPLSQVALSPDWQAIEDPEARKDVLRGWTKSTLDSLEGAALDVRDAERVYAELLVAENAVAEDGDIVEAAKKAPAILNQKLGEVRAVASTPNMIKSRGTIEQGKWKVTGEGQLEIDPAEAYLPEKDYIGYVDSLTDATPEEKLRLKATYQYRRAAAYENIARTMKEARFERMSMVQPGRTEKFRGEEQGFVYLRGKEIPFEDVSEVVLTPQRYVNYEEKGGAQEALFSADPAVRKEAEARTALQLAKHILPASNQHRLAGMVLADPEGPEAKALVEQHRDYLKSTLWVKPGDIKDNTWEKARVLSDGEVTVNGNWARTYPENFSEVAAAIGAPGKADSIEKQVKDSQEAQALYLIAHGGAIDSDFDPFVAKMKQEGVTDPVEIMKAWDAEYDTLDNINAGLMDAVRQFQGIQTGLLGLIAAFTPDNNYFQDLVADRVMTSQMEAEIEELLAGSNKSPLIRGIATEVPWILGSLVVGAALRSAGRAAVSRAISPAARAEAVNLTNTAVNTAVAAENLAGKTAAQISSAGALVSNTYFGLQASRSFGGMYESAYAAKFEQAQAAGLDIEAAKRVASVGAVPPALAAGMATGYLMRVMPGGTESAIRSLADTATIGSLRKKFGAKAVSQIFANAEFSRTAYQYVSGLLGKGGLLKALGKTIGPAIAGATKEGIEEATDEAFQAALTKDFDPRMTLRAAMEQVVTAGYLGAVIGGSMTAVSNFMANRSTAAAYAEEKAKNSRLGQQAEELEKNGDTETAATMREAAGASPLQDIVSSITGTKMNPEVVEGVVNTSAMVSDPLEKDAADTLAAEITNQGKDVDVSVDEDPASPGKYRVRIAEVVADEPEEEAPAEDAPDLTKLSDADKQEYAARTKTNEGLASEEGTLAAKVSPFFEFKRDQKTKVLSFREKADLLENSALPAAEKAQLRADAQRLLDIRNQIAENAKWMREKVNPRKKAKKGTATEDVAGDVENLTDEDLSSQMEEDAAPPEGTDEKTTGKIREAVGKFYGAVDKALKAALKVTKAISRSYMIGQKYEARQKANKARYDRIVKAARDKDWVTFKEEIDNLRKIVRKTDDWVTESIEKLENELRTEFSIPADVEVKDFFDGKKTKDTPLVFQEPVSNSSAAKFKESYDTKNKQEADREARRKIAEQQRADRKKKPSETRAATRDEEVEQARRQNLRELDEIGGVEGLKSNLPQVLREIASRNSLLRPVIEAILGPGDFSVDVEVIDDPKAAPGWFQPAYGDQKAKIVYNIARRSARGVHDTIVHEVAHHVLDSYMERDWPADSPQAEAIREILAVQKAYQQRLMANLASYMRLANIDDAMAAAMEKEGVARDYFMQMAVAYTMSRDHTVRMEELRKAIADKRYSNDGFRDNLTEDESFEMFLDYDLSSTGYYQLRDAVSTQLYALGYSIDGTGTLDPSRFFANGVSKEFLSHMVTDPTFQNALDVVSREGAEAPTGFKRLLNSFRQLLTGKPAEGEQSFTLDTLEKLMRVDESPLPPAPTQDATEERNVPEDSISERPEADAGRPPAEAGGSYRSRKRRKKKKAASRRMTLAAGTHGIVFPNGFPADRGAAAFGPIMTRAASSFGFNREFPPVQFIQPVVMFPGENGEVSQLPGTGSPRFNDTVYTVEMDPSAMVRFINGRQTAADIADLNDGLVPVINQEIDSFFGQEPGPERRYILAGSKARLNQRRELAMTTAQLLSAFGAPRRNIWKLTGWIKNPVDGKWRWELSDEDASLDLNALENLYEARIRGFNDPVKLSDFLKHDTLYKTYPSASLIVFDYVDLGPDIHGLYTPKYNKITLSPIALDPLSTVLHELQHWVQEREGFVGGVDFDMAVEALPDPEFDEVLQQSIYFIRNEWDGRVKYKNLADESIEVLENPETTKAEAAKIIAAFPEIAYPIYLRVAGEYEARDVAARRRLTAADRRQILPYTSEDLDFADLLVPQEGNQWTSSVTDRLPDSIRTSVSETQLAEITEMYNGLTTEAGVLGIRDVLDAEPEVRMAVRELLQLDFLRMLASGSNDEGRFADVVSSLAQITRQGDPQASLDLSMTTVPSSQVTTTLNAFRGLRSRVAASPAPFTKGILESPKRALAVARELARAAAASPGISENDIARLVSADTMPALPGDQAILADVRKNLREIFPVLPAPRTATLTRTGENTYQDTEQRVEYRYTMPAGAFIESRLIGNRIQVSSAVPEYARKWKVEHELGHWLYRRTEYRPAFRKLWDSLSSKDRADINAAVEGLYSKDVLTEEKEVRALELIRTRASKKPLWRKFVDAVSRLWKKVTGRDVLDAEQLASRMIAVASHDLFILDRMTPEIVNFYNNEENFTETEEAEVRYSAQTRLRQTTVPGEKAFLETNRQWVDDYDSANQGNKESIEDLAGKFLEASPELIVKASPRQQYGADRLITEGRKINLERVLSYFEDNVGEGRAYTKSEAAAIVGVLLKRSITWRASSTAVDGTLIPGKLDDASIEPTNDHHGSNFNGAIAAAAVTAIRGGAAPRRAYGQAVEDELKTEDGLGKTTRNRGWVHYEKGGDWETLQDDTEGCSGRWCIGRGMASHYLENGSFEIFFDDTGRAKVAIHHFDGEVNEISGSLEGQHLDGLFESELAISKVKELGLTGADPVVADMERRKSFELFSKGITDTIPVDIVVVDAFNGLEFNTKRLHKRYAQAPLFEPKEKDITRLNEIFERSSEEQAVEFFNRLFSQDNPSLDAVIKKIKWGLPQNLKGFNAFAKNKINEVRKQIINGNNVAEQTKQQIALFLNRIKFTHEDIKDYVDNSNNYFDAALLSNYYLSDLSKNYILNKYLDDPLNKTFNESDYAKGQDPEFLLGVTDVFAIISLVPVQALEFHDKVFSLLSSQKVIDRYNIKHAKNVVRNLIRYASSDDAPVLDRLWFGPSINAEVAPTAFDLIKSDSLSEKLLTDIFTSLSSLYEKKYVRENGLDMYALKDFLVNSARQYNITTGVKEKILELLREYMGGPYDESRDFLGGVGTKAVEVIDELLANKKVSIDVAKTVKKEMGQIFERVLDKKQSSLSSTISYTTDQDIIRFYFESVYKPDQGMNASRSWYSEGELELIKRIAENHNVPFDVLEKIKKDFVSEEIQEKVIKTENSYTYNKNKENQQRMLAERETRATRPATGASNLFNTLAQMHTAIPGIPDSEVLGFSASGEIVTVHPVNPEMPSEAEWMAFTGARPSGEGYVVTDTTGVEREASMTFSQSGSDIRYTQPRSRGRVRSPLYRMFGPKGKQTERAREQRLRDLTGVLSGIAYYASDTGKWGDLASIYRRMLAETESAVEFAQKWADEMMALREGLPQNVVDDVNLLLGNQDNVYDQKMETDARDAYRKGRRKAALKYNARMKAAALMPVAQKQLMQASASTDFASEIALLDGALSNDLIAAAHAGHAKFTLDQAAARARLQAGNYDSIIRSADRMRSRLNELGAVISQVNGTDPHLVATFDSRKGIHLSRYYQIHDDASYADWLDSPDPEARRLRTAAFNYIRGERFNSMVQGYKLVNKGATTQQAVAYANAYFAQQGNEPILRELNDFITKQMRGGGSATRGLVNAALLIEKSNIPAPLRDLLGQYSDNTVVAARTAMEMAVYHANYKFLHGIQEHLNKLEEDRKVRVAFLAAKTNRTPAEDEEYRDLDNIMFLTANSDEAKKHGLTLFEPSQTRISHKAFGPLQQFYGPKHIVEAIQELQPELSNTLVNTYAFFLNAALKGATSLNLRGQARNFFSNIALIPGSGFIPLLDRFMDVGNRLAGKELQHRHSARVADLVKSGLPEADAKRQASLEFAEFYAKAGITGGSDLDSLMRDINKIAGVGLDEAFIEMQKGVLAKNASRFASGTLEVLKATDRAAGEIYRRTDDLFKMEIFENLYRGYAKAFGLKFKGGQLVMTNANKEADKIIKAYENEKLLTTDEDRALGSDVLARAELLLLRYSARATRVSIPYYDQLPQIINNIKRQKLTMITAPFVSWPAAILQNTFRTPGLIWKDLQTKETRGMGYRRLAGFTIAVFGWGFLVQNILKGLILLMGKALGDDEDNWFTDFEPREVAFFNSEMEKALQDLLPDYYKYRDVSLLGMKGDKPVWADLSWMNPYSTVRDMFMPFFHPRASETSFGKNDAWAAFVAKLGQLVLNPQLPISAAYEELTRPDFDVQTASWPEKVLLVMKGVGSTVIPGTVKDFYKIYKASGTEKMWPEAASMVFGLKINVLDVEDQFRRAIRKTDSLDDELGMKLRKIYRDGDANQIQDLPEEYEKAMRNRNELYTDLRNIYESSSVFIGSRATKILTSDEGRRLGQENIRALRSGFVNPIEVSDFARDVARAKDFREGTNRVRLMDSIIRQHGRKLIGYPE